MAEDNGSRLSAPMMMGLAVVSVVVALVIVFGLGGDDSEDQPAPAPAAPPTAETAAVPRPGPLEPAPMITDAPTTQQPVALEPSSAGEYVLPTATPPPPWDPSSVRIPREVQDERNRMPKRVAEDFARGTAPISEDRREEMRLGIPEIPVHVEREFEDAAHRPIPPEVLEDFKNPYPPISDEELEMLRRNGRIAEAP